MKKIFSIVIIAIIFSWFFLFRFLFSPGKIEIKNSVNEKFSGKIEFSRNENLLSVENLQIKNNEKIILHPPKSFNEGKIL